MWGTLPYVVGHVARPDKFYPTENPFHSTENPLNHPIYMILLQTAVTYTCLHRGQIPTTICMFVNQGMPYCNRDLKIDKLRFYYYNWFIIGLRFSWGC